MAVVTGMTEAPGVAGVPEAEAAVEATTTDGTAEMTSGIVKDGALTMTLGVAVVAEATVVIEGMVGTVMTVHPTPPLVETSVNPQARQHLMPNLLLDLLVHRYVSVSYRTHGAGLDTAWRRRKRIVWNKLEGYNSC